MVSKPSTNLEFSPILMVELYHSDLSGTVASGFDIIRSSRSIALARQIDNVVDYNYPQFG
ncbi:hypothetical protein [Okeania sp. SIO3I5]|uniref:hypothetical protein n=1 Tax=Okeania sp. SIO3I5 TaxID=2607805 RepID=UPI0025DBBF1A|nr:hypothetical protein [Okeania sp. SIO3I5]